MPDGLLSSTALAGLSDADRKTIDIVARTAWGEARDQGEDGMQAVINTVMNRVALRSWYGLNPVAVCLKSCQYSAWNKGDVNRSKLLAVNDNDPQFAIALKLARLAVTGSLPDLTDGAVNYYVAGTPTPDWASTMIFTVQIGAHRFYRSAA